VARLAEAERARRLLAAAPAEAAEHAGEPAARPAQLELDLLERQPVGGAIEQEVEDGPHARGDVLVERPGLLGELGRDVEGVLEVASVVGREFESELVTEVSDLEADSVVAALESAVTAGLLIDVPGTLDRYAFSTLRAVAIALDAPVDWKVLRARYPAAHPATLLDPERATTLADAERDAAWTRIRTAAKKYHVEVNEKSWRELK